MNFRFRNAWLLGHTRDRDIRDVTVTVTVTGFAYSDMSAGQGKNQGKCLQRRQGREMQVCYENVKKKIEENRREEREEREEDQGWQLYLLEVDRSMRYRSLGRGVS